jgi:adenylate cyclase
MVKVDGGQLTRQELAAATGASIDDLRRWESLGLIGRDGDLHPDPDIERVRLVQYVQSRGVDPEILAKASDAQGDLVGNYVGMITGGQVRLGRPPEEVADEIGLAPRVLDRLLSASGLGDQAEVYEDDVVALGWLRTALDTGLPEDALVQIVRVFADSLGRVAEAESRLFHLYVHERLRADGLTGAELIDASNSVGEPLEELIEPAIVYFHRKAYQRALREDLLLHLVEEATPPSDVIGEMRATILFVDLSGFTSLTEAMGDAAAASLMERFSDLVRQAAAQWHGRVVKQIGDEFMLSFTDPSAAATCGLDIVGAAAAQPQFPALRLGAHTGSVLYREGDYIGATVNVAARLTAHASRHQFLITDALRIHAIGLSDVEIHPIGAHDLRGVPGPVDLFEVRRPAARLRRTIDPVCLMELDPASIAARLDRHGHELHFCSDDCLKLFVATPERYDPSATS